MKPLPTTPAPGTPVSSSLIRELIDAIRARTILRGKGYRTNETPNGTFLEIERAAAGRSATYKKIPGRFEITLTPDDPPEEGSEEETTYSATFANPYYDIGGKTFEMEEATEKVVTEGDIIALKVTARGGNPIAVLDIYKSIAHIRSAQSNYDYFIRPLYKIGSGGSIECDFRTGPTLDMGEPE